MLAFGIESTGVRDAHAECNATRGRNGDGNERVLRVAGLTMFSQRVDLDAPAARVWQSHHGFLHSDTAITSLHQRAGQHIYLSDNQLSMAVEHYR